MAFSVGFLGKSRFSAQSSRFKNLTGTKSVGSVISATFWKNFDHRFSMVVPWEARKKSGVSSIFDFFVVFCNFEAALGGFEGLQGAHTTFLWFQKAFVSFLCLQRADCMSFRETVVGEGRRKETLVLGQTLRGITGFQKSVIPR